MPFSITAEVPLGTYRGHTPDGWGERIPSVSRLHSALLCAAGFGPRATERDGELGPCEQDELALRWLEDNPPDAVTIPSMEVNRAQATAYRDDGTIKRDRRSARINKNPKPADTSVAVNGCFRWTWSTSPPRTIVAALEALCPDVPHLGTTESPVRLLTDLEEHTATHVLDTGAGAFARKAGEDIDLPDTGRTDELIATHAAARSTAPTVAADRPKTDERSSAPPTPRLAVRPARYTEASADSGDVPWTEVVVLPLDREIPARYAVRWAVAAHRALIALVGDGAPPVLTGAYPTGTARPSNRIALQVLDRHWRPDESGSAHSALAITIPRGAADADVAVVLDAVRRMRRFRGPGGRVAAVREIRHLSGERFWPEPPPGSVRLWRTWPVAVPDTRGDGPDWTFRHAALLSLGFVWQGSAHVPQVPGRSSTRNRGLVDAVNAAGAVVVSCRPLRTSRIEDYVHRVNDGAVVRPYTATIALGALGGDRTVQAIGQSRHLGGGLLVPHDVPEGTPLDSLNVGDSS